MISPASDPRDRLLDPSAWHGHQRLVGSHAERQMKDMMRDDVAGPCVSASGSLPPDMYWAADRVLITNNRSDNRGMLERDRAATARAAGRLLKVLLNSAALESDANYE